VAYAVEVKVDLQAVKDE